MKAVHQMDFLFQLFDEQITVFLQAQQTGMKSYTK